MRDKGRECQHDQRGAQEGSGVASDGRRSRRRIVRLAFCLPDFGLDVDLALTRSGELCSGNMLLEALTACAGVTLSSVATAMNIEIESGDVRAEGKLAS